MSIAADPSDFDHADDISDCPVVDLIGFFHDVHPVEMKRRVHDFASTAASVVASFVESNKNGNWRAAASASGGLLRLLRLLLEGCCVCFVVLCVLKSSALSLLLCSALGSLLLCWCTSLLVH